MFKNITHSTLNCGEHDHVITFWHWNNPYCDMVPLTESLSVRVTLASSCCFTLASLYSAWRLKNDHKERYFTVKKGAGHLGQDHLCQTQRQIDGAVILYCVLSDKTGRLTRCWGHISTEWWELNYHAGARLPDHGNNHILSKSIFAL